MAYHYGACGGDEAVAEGEDVQRDGEHAIEADDTPVAEGDHEFHTNWPLRKLCQVRLLQLVFRRIEPWNDIKR